MGLHKVLKNILIESHESCPIFSEYIDHVNCNTKQHDRKDAFSGLLMQIEHVRLGDQR